MSHPVFRFAPSPNGELHLGHAYSALLNARMAASCGGRFLVRIEDIDTVRCTPLLARRALEDLAWLGLVWEEPVRFQSHHFSDYFMHQRHLADLGLLYPCFCSRTMVSNRCRNSSRDPDGQPLYDGYCRALPCSVVGARLTGGEPHVLRIDMAAAIRMSGLDPAALAWGDVVLVRRDIGTSYHIAVVTDDAMQGVTHVVRGKDLEAATSIHRLLQNLLALPTPDYTHHDLIMDGHDLKLSKSLGSTSLRMMRDWGVTPSGIRAALGFN